MAFGFHDKVLSWFGRLTLTGFESGLDLVDHVDSPLTADHLASGMALLGGFDGGDDFHRKETKTPSPLPPVNGLLDSVLNRLFIKELSQSSPQPPIQIGPTFRPHHPHSNQFTLRIPPAKVALRLKLGAKPA
jgi:hypothetical protein